MKIAVCYRGHFRRTYVAEDSIKYNVDFFKNLNNHKEKLLNNLNDVWNFESKANIRSDVFLSRSHGFG